MEMEVLSRLRGTKRHMWQELLQRSGLTADESAEQTVLLWDDDRLAAAGSRQGNLLKCIAVDPDRQGDGLTATLLTALRQEAFRDGHRHLFLYTKPENRAIFSSLFFYPIAQTEKVLLMEDQKDGIRRFLEGLPVRSCSGDVGSVVMNCNPFTLGHRWLIETAAASCEHLYVFVLSEDKSRFSAADRLEMVRLGTADLSNVTVLPTGPYLISSATFPTYFLKERDSAPDIHCALDLEIFTRYFVPRFSITHRFVGTEPLSPATGRYNDALKAHLPPRGVSLLELPRPEQAGQPVSASAVRALLDSGDISSVRALVPPTTFDYLQARGLL